MFAGAAKAILATVTLFKVLHHIEIHLHYRHYHQLRDPLQRIQQERRVPTIPAGDKYLPLIIGVDQSDQIAQDYAMLVAQPGARQNYCCESGVSKMDGDAGGDKAGFPRLDSHHMFSAGTQIKARRIGSGIGWKLSF